MKKVGIYRKAFPRISESFIGQQACNLTRYDPVFITCTLLKEVPFKTASISEDDPFKVKQLIYLLKRSPVFFKHQDAIKNLSLIHAHFGPDGVYAMPIAESLNIPFLVTFHGYDATISRKSEWNGKPPLYYQLIWHEEELKEKAVGFIAVSNFVRAKLIEQGYPEEKVIQHYIGVNTDEFSPIEKKTGERYILCVGRHVEKKGIDVLLRAFAQIAHKYPNISLIQVGTGEKTRMLIGLVKQLGLEKQVHFFGARQHDEVRKLMQNAEIFALPSQTAKNGNSETLGLVFNEASACGIPIVSTLHGGIPEAVINNETGFLVPEQDYQALAEKVDRLLSNPNLGKEMGKQGRKHVCKNFDIRKQTLKLETLYDRFSSNS